MKKILLTLVALATFAVGGAKAQTDVTPIVGNYVGDLYVALGEELYDDDSKLTDPTTVQLTASSEAGKVDLKLSNFSFEGNLLGDILLPGIEVKSGANGYTFGDNERQSFSFLDGNIEAIASLEVERSYVKGDSLVAYIPVFWLYEGYEIPIYVLFQGVKQASNDEESGIHDIVLTPAAKATGVYTIAGVRIANRRSETLAPGLYIIDGKKEIVR